MSNKRLIQPPSFTHSQEIVCIHVVPNDGVSSISSEVTFTTSETLSTRMPVITLFVLITMMQVSSVMTVVSMPNFTFRSIIG